MQDDVTVRPAHERDLAVMLELADRSLGTGYFDSTTIEELTSRERSMAFVASRQSQIVGFVICAERSVAEAKAALRLSAPRYFDRPGRIGALQTIVVDERMRQCGIGSALVEESLQWFRSNDIGVAYSVAWDNGDTVPMRGILRRFGFRLLGVQADYWTQSSLTEQYDCPTCGSPPCHCNAEIYTAVLAHTP